MGLFDNYLIHASGYHKLLTEPKSKADKEAGLLSVTTKTYLREIYRAVAYDRVKRITTKYTEKGIRQEEEAITLYCRTRKKLYHKNELRIENDFITGEPDLVDNHKDIFLTEKGVDIKCSWDIFTFPFADDKLSDAYYGQNQNYMYLLPNSKSWVTAFCLVNAPPDMITEAKKKLYFQMGCPADNEPNYVTGCQEIEKNMIFNIEEFQEACQREKVIFDFHLEEWQYDIPFEERVVEFEVERDNFYIEGIPDNVRKARNYMNSLMR